jgi:ubiquinone/menaquinone biosynthesis C-methylase UbiE
MEKEFLNPEKILEKLEFHKKMRVADFGCGSGGWAIPLAKRVQWVFALDLQPEALSALRSKMKMDKVFNIDPLLADVEEKTTLLSESCDWVLMTNLLFQVKNKKKVLEEGKRVLKKGGKILIVDWVKDNPVTEEVEYVDFEKIKSIANELGLKVEQEFEGGIYHKVLVLVK